MTPAEIIHEVHCHGGEIEAAGDRLNLRAPAPLPGDLVDRIRRHKADLLGELSAETQARTNTRVFRYRITDYPDQWPYILAPGLTLAEAEAELRRRYGDRLLEVRPHATPRK